MKKSGLLFMAALLLTAVQGWAEGSTPAVITPSIEALDFGSLELGYPVTKIFTVTGSNLTEDICLAVEGQGCNFYEATPGVITPEAAASGATVKVKCLPRSSYLNGKEVNIVLSSFDAEDVVIPVTATVLNPENTFVNKMTEEFVAPIFGIQKRRAVVRFDFISVPTDPTVVDRAMAGLDDASIVPPYYSYSIEGPDSDNFMARYIKGSTLFGIATLEISYVPKTSGSHSATLKLDCAISGSSPVTIPLMGEATGELGDINDDGVIGIGDVTGIIGLLLNDAEDFPPADLNCDGLITITDVTLLIARLLEVE